MVRVLWLRVRGLGIVRVRGQEEFAGGSGRSGCTGVAVCWRVYVQTAPLVVVVVVLVVVVVVVCVCV